ncbi:hypothetical protein [Mesobacillus maritimus]|uniref:Uncharacterized protein n=1 Tax=Mesobacillus maritimus TaxID=1643336 RepID=A0ABS7K8B4_9BACI|nr:hypothetical protein [Mesobacillus maritimus]MBY0098470.1 hypothetical protein [Mesobacillus maritimus]
MRLQKKYHKYPYLLLLFIHSSLLIYTFLKSKNRKRTFIALISNIGMAYIFEYFTYNIFKAYRYKPALLKNKSLDSILGAIFSQAIFIPFTALYISVFHLGWKFKLLASLYFASIEHLFVRLDIYKHYWWKTIYTLTLLPVYFSITSKWDELLKKRNPVILFVSYFNLILVTSVNLLFFLSILGKVRFGFRRFTSWREHFILMPLYSILMGLFTAQTLKEKSTFLFNVKSLFYRLLLDWLMVKIKILKFPKKNVLLNLPYHVLMLLLANFYKSLVYKRK